MSKMETKIEEVEPPGPLEAEKIDFMQKLGYTLFSTETVQRHNPYGPDDYVKMVFQRPVDLPNIEKLRQLEKEHEDATYSWEKIDIDVVSPQISLWVGLAALILGWIFISFTGGAIIGIIAAAGWVFFASRRNSAYESASNARDARRQERIEAVMREIDSL